MSFLLEAAPTSTEIFTAASKSVFPDIICDKKIVHACAKIPFLLYEIAERYDHCTVTDFYWEDLEYTYLKDAIEQHSKIIQEIHLDKLSNVWKDAFGPFLLSTEDRPSSYTLGSFAEKICIHSTTTIVIKLLRSMRIKMSISENSLFSRLGVMIYDDSDGKKFSSLSNTIPILMSQSMYEEKIRFIEEKVVIRKAEMSLFRNKIKEAFARILCIQNGHKYLQRCEKALGIDRLPEIHSHTSNQCFIITTCPKLTSIGINNSRKPLKFISAIDSSFYSFFSPLHLAIVHELAHGCLQHDMRKVDFPLLTFQFHVAQIKDLDDLWDNNWEVGAIEEENNLRGFYPKRMYHYIYCGPKQRIEKRERKDLQLYLSQFTINQLIGEVRFYKFWLRAIILPGYKKGAYTKEQINIYKHNFLLLYDCTLQRIKQQESCFSLVKLPYLTPYLYLSR